MKRIDFPEDKRQSYKVSEYPDPNFPIQMYTATRDKIVPPGRGYQDLHWHDEPQFTLVLNGYVEYYVNGTHYEIQKNEAIFINSMCLHQTRYISDDARYTSIAFYPDILCFMPGSTMEQKYVSPYIKDNMLEAIVFHPRDWGGEVIKRLRKVREYLLDNDGKDHEYEVSVLMVSIWLLIIRNVKPHSMKLPERTKDNYLNKQKRMRKMLLYIYEHYQEKIRLKDIADVVNISEGECNRCFQEMVNMSPIKYLIDFRLIRAASLLRNADKSVAEIAQMTGFSDSSHFIKCFREKYDLTPNEFRRQHGRSG